MSNTFHNISKCVVLLLLANITLSLKCISIVFYQKSSITRSGIEAIISHVFHHHEMRSGFAFTHPRNVSSMAAHDNYKQRGAGPLYFTIYW